MVVVCANRQRSDGQDKERGVLQYAALSCAVGSYPQSAVLDSGQFFLDSIEGHFVGPFYYPAEAV